ncbi:hypothetical protein [Botryobacter ruber]|uniref:hypothetical protein n=1 Tax=Botryobacter ruber TaxID=2171629 RepID=UPI000E0AECA2|nr:hypothetical protein [Botryobacter ruber]
MKRKMLTRLLGVGLVLMLSFTATDAFSQCAMCRATVESNVGTGSKEPESDVGAGLNKGILYLMAIPYILIGTVGFFWYRNSRKSHA